MKRILATVAVMGLLAACSSATDDPPETTDTVDPEGSAGPGDATDEDTGSETTEPAETDEDTVETDEPAETEDTDSPDPDDEAPSEDFSDFTINATESEGFPDLLGNYLPIEARVGGHEGYDRVVIEYDDGEGQLNWAASYEDTPIEDGTGFPVEMEGERFLTLTVAGTRYPHEGELTADSRIIPSGLNQSEVIADVHVDYPFEGMHMAFIGVDEDRPYRVQVLYDPARLVVDIQNN